MLFTNKTMFRYCRYPKSASGYGANNALINRLKPKNSWTTHKLKKVLYENIPRHQEALATLQKVEKRKIADQSDQSDRGASGGRLRPLNATPSPKKDKRIPTGPGFYEDPPTPGDTPMAASATKPSLKRPLSVNVDVTKTVNVPFIFIKTIKLGF